MSFERGHGAWPRNTPLKCWPNVFARGHMHMISFEELSIIFCDPKGKSSGKIWERDVILTMRTAYCQSVLGVRCIAGGGGINSDCEGTLRRRSETSGMCCRPAYMVLRTRCTVSCERPACPAAHCTICSPTLSVSIPSAAAVPSGIAAPGMVAPLEFGLEAAWSTAFSSSDCILDAAMAEGGGRREASAGRVDILESERCRIDFTSESGSDYLYLTGTRYAFFFLVFS